MPILKPWSLDCGMDCCLLSKIINLVFPGAKFRKYVGHSAHVTNVRFSHNQQHVISLGGADHAIFQWRFLPGGEEGEEEPLARGAAMESDSEESDSDMSDAPPVDSDLEHEQEKTYERCVGGSQGDRECCLRYSSFIFSVRTVYREDLHLLKEKLQSKQQQEGAGPSGRGIKASGASRGKKSEVPEDSLSLEFVHG